MPSPKFGAATHVTVDQHVYKFSDYEVEEVEPLAQQIMSDLTSGQKSYKYETAARFLTWHLGFGLGEIRDAADQGRYHYSKNVDARFRGQLILGPQLSTSAFNGHSESIVQFIEFNAQFYAVGTRYVHKFNQSTGQWDDAQDLGASATTVKGCAAVYGAYMVVGAGSSVDYWRLASDGTTWDQPASSKKADLFALVGNTLWRLYSSNQLSSSTDFTTWATAVSIGTVQNVATMLSDYNGNPLVGKPEGLFEYDGTKVSNRLPELAFRISTTNCRGGKPSRGMLFLPVGPAVWQYTADAIQTEGKPTRSAEALAPGISRESSNEVRGPILDLWPDVDFMWGIFAAVSGNYYIVAYDYNPSVGQGWHQVAMTSQTSTTALGRFQPSSGNPRLFYSEGTTIKYFLLPQNALNPFVDTNYLYATTGDIYLPVEADTYDDTVKAYLSVKINCDGVNGSTRYIDVAYSLDGGVDTTLGRVTSSGISTLFFPSSTTGRRMSIHIKLTGDGTITPRMLPFTRNYKLRFDRKQLWKMNLILTRKGLPQTPRQGLDQLISVESARDSQSPVSFIDKDSRQWTVFVENLGIAQPEDDGGPDQVWKVPLQLLEWRSGLGINRWNDANTVYDQTAIWSNGTDSYAAYWS